VPAWWKDEITALEGDIKEFSTAIGNNRLGDAYEVARRRVGLIVGVVVPLLVLLRWPGAALAVLRGATPIITVFVGGISRLLLRNPRLLAPVLGFLHQFVASTWRRMAAQARDRVKRNPPKS